MEEIETNPEFRVVVPSSLPEERVFILGLSNI